MRLSQTGQAIFQAAQRYETLLLISAISIAEMFYAHHKHRLFSDFKLVYTALRSEPYIDLIPFTADDVLDFEADTAVPEMHDRIITGLAKRVNAPLLTLDPLITAAGLVKVVW